MSDMLPTAALALVEVEVCDCGWGAHWLLCLLNYRMVF